MAMKILTEMRFSKLYIVGVTVYSEGALTTFFIFNFFLLWNNNKITV